MADNLMKQAKVELQLSPKIYQRAQEIAQTSNRSLETVLLEGLSLLFGELPPLDLMPDQLMAYDDEQLWALVHQHLAWPQEARLSDLVERGKQGQLSELEQAEMERLISLVDHYMLLRSQALFILKQRGHLIEKQLRLGA